MERDELYRGKTWIAGGVCAGIADYYGLRKGVIQGVFVLGTIMFLVPVFILYCGCLYLNDHAKTQKQF